jgi:hypothetical protein
MATEDIIIRLKAENEDLKRKLEESKKGFQALEGGVERTGKAGVQAGDQVSKGLDEGTEATRRIAKAMESLRSETADVAKGAKIAEQAFEALGGSPAEFIAKANTNLERTVILLADAEKNIVQLDEESREGLSGFADRAAKARQRMAELRDITERLGDDSTPELRQELARLEEQFERTFVEGKQRAAQLEAQIEDTEFEMRSLKDASRQSGEGISGLDDLLRGLSGGLGKTVISTGAAIAVFKEMFSLTRSFIDTLKELTGIDIDAKMQGFVSRVIDAGDAERRAKDETQALEAAYRSLREKGVDPTGMSLRQTTAAMLEWQLAAQGGEKATARAELGYARFVERLAGKTIKDGIAEMEKLTEVMNRAAESGDLQAASMDLLLSTAEQLLKTFEPLGDVIDNSMNEEKQKQTLAQVEAFKKLVASLREARDEGEGLSEGMSNLQTSTEGAAEETERLAEEMAGLEEAASSARDTIADVIDTQEQLRKLQDKEPPGREEEIQQSEQVVEKERELAKVREEIAGLEKESLVDGEKLAELKDKELDLELELNRARQTGLGEGLEGTEQLTEAQSDLNDTLLDGVANLEKFKTSTEGLSDASRSEIEAIIARFRQMGETVDVSRADLDEFSLLSDIALGRVKDSAEQNLAAAEDQMKSYSEQVEEAEKITNRLGENIIVAGKSLEEFERDSIKNMTADADEANRRFETMVNQTRIIVGNLREAAEAVKDIGDTLGD